MSATTQPSRLTASLPAAVVEVLTCFMTAEVTTIGKNGYPVSWPILPIFCPEPFQFVILTSIGLQQKAVNIRRDGRVSLLYSEPAGSGLSQPPAVLVQGRADAPDRILASMNELAPGVQQAARAQALNLVRKQPGMQMYLANPLSRWLMDWYFMRQVITIYPLRISWWPHADFSHAPEVVEVSHVG